MNSKFFASLCVFFFSCGAAMAGGGNNVSSLNSSWGNSTMNTCGAHDITNSEACIGASQKTQCKNWAVYARNYTDEYSVQMMVARVVNENGAKFCPTQVEGKNKNKGYAWTEYGDLSGGNDSLCVWLCKKGHTGPECSESSASPSSCDISTLERENYYSIPRLANGTNIEDSVAMFAFNDYRSCGVHKGQEHDMILAITRYLPSGHGAFVRQMVVRAERSGWKNMISTATIYPAQNSSEILVCKNGYGPNPANTECEELNATNCRLQSMCTGWGTGFDETIHAFIQPSGSTCFQYRCAEIGKAFASDTNRASCVDCNSNLRDGVSPVDGTCIKCDIGKIFSETATATGFCADAMGYTKTDLQYGKGKTKNSQPDVAKQCWPIATPDDYKMCVVNGGAQTSSSN